MSRIPIRGVKFYSGSRSTMLRGPSGKTYQFFREQDTAPVTDPRDIQYFRSRDDVFEEGTDPSLIQGTRNRGVKNRPKSYRTTGRRNIDPSLLVPPSEEKLREAEERRILYERRTKESQDSVAAKATAEIGVGTKEAQLKRQANAAAAAGRDKLVEKKQAPPKSTMTPASSPEPEVDTVEEIKNEAVVPEKTEPVKEAVPPKKESPKKESPKETPVKKDVNKNEKIHKCQFCDRGFSSKQAVRTHENKWCKKNPSLKK